MKALDNSSQRSSTARKRAWLIACLAGAIAGIVYLMFGRVLEPAPEPDASRSELEPANPASSVRTATASPSPDDTKREIAASGSSTTWRIRVLDSSTHEPVSGARAKLTAREVEAEATSAADGSVELVIADRPEVRSADLLVDHPEYMSTRVPSLPPDDRRDVLLVRGGEIVGRVAPNPSSTATISLSQQTSEDANAWPIRNVETDAQGGFRFTRLPPGDYTLAATVAGWCTPTLHGLRVESGKTRDVTLPLTRGATLRGRLLSLGTEVAIEKAHVTMNLEDIYRAPHEILQPREAVTDSAGRFEFHDLPPTAYTLLFRVPDQSTFRRQITIHNIGEAIDQEFYAPAMLQFHGRVVDLEGRPMPGAIVALTDEFRWREVIARGLDAFNADGCASARAGADGKFIIRAQFDADTSLYVLGRSTDQAELGMAWSVLSRRLSSKESDVELGDLTIGNTSILRGLVKNEHGLPVAGATVEILDPGRHPRNPVTSTGDGAFSIPVLDFGGRIVLLTTLSARSPGFVSDHVNLIKSNDSIELVLHPVHVVRGRVIDTDGRAVPNIQVVLGTPLPEHKRGPRVGGGDIPQNTDEFGRFRFEEVVRMQSEIGLNPAVQSDWTIESRDPALIPADGDQEVKVVLRHVAEEERATLRGRLVIAKEFDSLEELRIEVLPQQADSNVPNPNGYGYGSKKRGMLERTGDSFVLSNVPPGRIVFEVSCHHCVPVTRPIELRPGEVFDLGDVPIDRGVYVTVHLTDANGKPVGGATVEFVPLEPGRSPHQALAEQGGVYWGLPPCGRTFDIRVHRAGKEDYSQRFEAPCDHQSTVEVRVE
jgi:protocatechuate 3,4-dioxygenase beta subunit